MTLSRQTSSASACCGRHPHRCRTRGGELHRWRRRRTAAAAAYVVTLVVSLIVALALFGWAIPGIERPARAGLVVGCSLCSRCRLLDGSPVRAGTGGDRARLLGRARSEVGMLARVAVVLGVLATVGGIAVVVLDQVA